MYSIPLSCGQLYARKTGRCPNDPLPEHPYNVDTVVTGHLGIHCRDYGCIPSIEYCAVLNNNKDRITREILKAREIGILEPHYVSAPSLLYKELRLFGRMGGASDRAVCDM